MAAPSSTQRLRNISHPSSESWARSGEPGSAFNGLSRGKSRGTGRGRGRGGRSAAPSDSKSTSADALTDKRNTESKVIPTPNSKPATPSVLLVADKPPVPHNVPKSPTYSKGGLRRPSRTVPPIITPLQSNMNPPDTPNSSRPSNRRRRSQSGKHASALPKAPSSHLTSPTPHTAPIKDVPPHLPSATFDIRNNIDALVERVRAVAMADNRPTTPRSHIDWAGDDDDTLPDLDDWVIPATAAVNKNEKISPIIVDGLKSLPDVVAEPHTYIPSPESPETTSSLRSDNTPTNNVVKLIADQTYQSSATGSDISYPDDMHITNPIILTQEPLFSAPASARVSLHPPLPPELQGSTDVPSSSPQNLGVAAINEGHDEIPIPLKGDECPDPVSESPDNSKPEKESMNKLASASGLMASIHAVERKDTDGEDPFAAISARDGLAASIHAPVPSGISESQSAPSYILTHPQANLSPAFASASLGQRTHIRANTVGRAAFPRPNPSSRSSRSGYNTPRGGVAVEGHHTRTHSTPPIGVHNQRGHHAQRPVITGDALSRLARTIGNTTPPTIAVPTTNS